MAYGFTGREGVSEIFELKLLAPQRVERCFEGLHERGNFPHDVWGGFESGLAFAGLVPGIGRAVLAIDLILILLTGAISSIVYHAVALGHGGDVEAALGLAAIVAALVIPGLALRGNYDPRAVSPGASTRASPAYMGWNVPVSRRRRVLPKTGHRVLPRRRSDLRWRRRGGSLSAPGGMAVCAEIQPHLGAVPLD